MAYGTPSRLYTSADLLDGYDPNDPMAFTKSWDFKTYRTYVADGALQRRRPWTSVARKPTMMPISRTR